MEEVVTPTTPENTEQAFSEQGTQERPLSSETPDGGNPLEDFFRVNGVEQEEPKPDVFETEGVAPPRVAEQPTQKEEPQVDNDEKRYQYWQSEADKARNEKQALEARLQALEVQQAQPQAVQQTQEPEPDLSFPPPPEKPNKPSGFSREDAYADPSSDSAKYLDSVENWRDDMDDYNRLHNEFNTALVEEERQKINQERQNILKAEADKKQYQQQMGNIANHLTTNYNASAEEVNKFIEVMDKPESVSIDNLFQLFRLQNGNAPATPASQPITETAPNESFEQMKRAQQVPSTMGVLPSQGSTASGTPEDNMMDSMVSDFNNRNPW